MPNPIPTGLARPSQTQSNRNGFLVIGAVTPKTPPTGRAGKTGQQPVDAVFGSATDDGVTLLGVSTHLPVSGQHKTFAIRRFPTWTI